MLYNIPNPANGKQHFGGSAYALEKLGLDTKMTVYVGHPRAGRQPDRRRRLARSCPRLPRSTDGVDATRPTDYFADEGDPRVKDLDLTP